MQVVGLVECGGLLSAAAGLYTDVSTVTGIVNASQNVYNGTAGVGDALAFLPVAVAGLKWAGALGEVNCFVAGTGVVAAPAADKPGYYTDLPIESVQVGNYVLSRDQDDPNAPEEERRVVAVYRHTVYDLRDLTVADADGRSQTLQLTPGHKVYIVGLGWTEAGQVTAGEHMVLADGSEAVVTANVDDPRPTDVTVYNFQVEGDHTYFVSTFASAYADGAVVAAGDALWVHNSCADVLRRNMRKAGSYGPGSDVPHHIVDRGAYSGRAANVRAALQDSKDVLKRAGISSLDEHWNGALLPKSAHTVSTNKYILTVSGRLVSAEARALAAGGSVRASVIQELQKIRAGLFLGTLTTGR